MPASATRLAELSMPTELAREVVAQIVSTTTAANAQLAAIDPLDTGTPPTREVIAQKLNEILAALKA